MKNKSKSFAFILLILITMLSSFIFIYAQNEVTIKLNNSKVGFPDAKPYMDTQVGRVLIPVRFVSESLGAEVKWDQVNKVVNIIKGKTNIRLKLGQKRFALNGIQKSMDTAAFLKDERTFVPIRFISESLDVDVNWDQKSYTVILNEKDINKEFVVQGIELGISEESQETVDKGRPIENVHMICPKCKTEITIPYAEYRKLS